MKCKINLKILKKKNPKTFKITKLNIIMHNKKKIIMKNNNNLGPCTHKMSPLLEIQHDEPIQDSESVTECFLM